MNYAFCICFVIVEEPCYGFLDKYTLFFKKNYENKLKIKIMFKLIRPIHVSIHISNTVVIYYDIIIFFKSMPQSLDTAL